MKPCRAMGRNVSDGTECPDFSSTYYFNAKKFLLNALRKKLLLKWSRFQISLQPVAVVGSMIFLGAVIIISVCYFS